MIKTLSILFITTVMAVSVQAKNFQNNSTKNSTFVDVENAKTYIKRLNNIAAKTKEKIAQLEQENLQSTKNISEAEASIKRMQPLVDKINKEIEVYNNSLSTKIIDKETNKQATEPYKINLYNRNKLNIKIAELSNIAVENKIKIDKNNKIIDKFKFRINKCNQFIASVEPCINKTNNRKNDIKAYSDKAILLARETEKMLNDIN